MQHTQSQEYQQQQHKIMIIALKKQLQIRDQDLKVINVNHWVVTDVVHRLDKEFVVLTINGYKNRQARINGYNPVVSGIRRKIKNTYDEENNIVTNDYNKFIRYQETDGKHKDLLRGAVLEFMLSMPEFADAVND